MKNASQSTSDVTVALAEGLHRTDRKEATQVKSTVRRKGKKKKKLWRKAEVVGNGQDFGVTRDRGLWTSTNFWKRMAN